MHVVREARFEVDQGWIEEVADAPTAVVTGSDGPGLSFG
jgi:quinol monooxygenase YgiN